jgi:prevent-host-death family protein
VKKVAAGKFKAQCLKVMDHIQATGEPVLVTKRGKPVVKVIPAGSEESGLFGFLAEELKISGDIESPVLPLSAWKVMKK